MLKTKPYLAFGEARNCKICHARRNAFPCYRSPFSTCTICHSQFSCGHRSQCSEGGVQELHNSPCLVIVNPPKGIEARPTQNLTRWPQSWGWPYKWRVLIANLHRSACCISWKQCTVITFPWKLKQSYITQRTWKILYIALLKYAWMFRDQDDFKGPYLSPVYTLSNDYLFTYFVWFISITYLLTIHFYLFII